MSRKYTSSVDSDDNEDSDREDSKPKREGNSINDILVRALAEASNPGYGDEEPEVLEAPSTSLSDDMHAGSQPSSRYIEMKRNNSGSNETQPDAKYVRNEKEIDIDDSNWSHERRIQERTRLMQEEEDKLSDIYSSIEQHSDVAVLPSEIMSERAKYIPVRLTYEERKSLRLVNAAINVSDYTTAIDIEFKNKSRRSHLQLQYIVAFLSGLLAATSYELGQEVLSDRNFVPHADLIKTLLEIARRYKITNPEKMRSEYGKLGESLPMHRLYIGLTIMYDRIILPSSYTCAFSVLDARCCVGELPELVGPQHLPTSADRVRCIAGSGRARLA